MWCALFCTKLSSIAQMVLIDQMGCSNVLHYHGVKHELVAALSMFANHNFICEVSVIGGVFLTARWWAHLEDRQQRHRLAVDFLTLPRDRQDNSDTRVFIIIIGVPTYIQ